MTDNRTEAKAFSTPLMDELCVIIPTYNNAGTLADVVKGTLKYVPHVIVVNDGSTDNTGAILKKLPKQVTIVSYLKNRGKGHALVKGFKKAKELGYRYAITIDSDGQHLPEDIPALVRAEEENPGSIIIGSRILAGKDIAKSSLFANKFSNFWFTVQTARNLPDTQTGYRLYPLHKLYWTSLITSRYESELELLVFAEWNNTKIVPVPINVFYPPREERISHFRPGYDFTRISILNTILCLGAVLYGYPCKLLRFTRTVLYTIFAILIFLIGTPLMTIFSYLFFAFSRKNDRTKLRYHKILCGVSRGLIRMIPGTKLRIKNKYKEKFDKPSVIISNHQSQFDLLCIMMLTPKLVILTKDWVWKNPLFGKIVKFADYYPVSNGIENCLEHLKNVVDKGYSVMIFPEGTRSADCSILRFHQGAFYIAEELGLDIVPVFIHGAGHVLAKKKKYLRKGKIYIEIDRRISAKSTKFGRNPREKRSGYENYYKKKYRTIKAKEGYE